MAYIDDKLEQADLQGQAAVDSSARARLSQLCARWQGPNLKDCVQMQPRRMTMYDMAGTPETWELDGDQHGTPWKDKLFKRTK